MPRNASDTHKTPRINQPREVRAERIEHIMRLMAEGYWIRGETGEELAAEWGLSHATIAGMAAEASRRVISAIPDEEFRALLVARLDAITEEAREIGRPGDAVRAIQSMAEMRGVTGRRLTIDDPLAKLTPDQLEAFARTGQLPPGTRL